MQALFSLGFILAVVYHICHMNVDGLQSSTILGISGPLWRTFDIICAQWLLARTFGHAVDATHWVTQGSVPSAQNEQAYMCQACACSVTILLLMRILDGHHIGDRQTHFQDYCALLCSGF